MGFLGVVKPGAHLVRVRGTPVGWCHRYKLGVTGRATGLGEHNRVFCSEDVARSGCHPHHVVLDVLIGDYRHLALEVGNGPDRGEVVTLAVFGAGVSAHHVQQQVGLYFAWILTGLVKTFCRAFSYKCDQFSCQ